MSDVDGGATARAGPGCWTEAYVARDTVALGWAYAGATQGADPTSQPICPTTMAVSLG